MKKRISVVLLVMLLALSTLFGGCAGNPAQSNESDASTESQPESTDGNNSVGGSATVNVMWLAGMNQTNVIRQVIEEKFSAENPNIEIVFTEVPNTEIANKAMMEATSKTGAYDVVMQNMTIPALVSLDALEPLDTFIERDSFEIEKMIDNGIYYQDHYYGLPVRGDVRLLHYNEEYFKAAGLDPEAPPTSIDEYKEYAKKLTADGHYGVNRRINDPDNFVSLLFQMGGTVLNDSTNEPEFNSDVGVKALELMIEQFDEGLVDPASTGWQYADEIAGYLSGGAAMFDAWPARYIDAKMPEKSSIVDKSRVAALPGEAALVSGWYIVMSSISKNKDAAWEFMKFVVDPDIQKEVISRGGDCNPTHLDVFQDAELQEKYEVLKAMNDCFDKTKIYCTSTQYVNIREILTTYIEQAAAKKMTAKEALDKAAAEVRTAMVEAGELS